VIQWQLPQLWDEQPPQELPLAELVNVSPALHPNVENSFSTFVPWHLGQSGLAEDKDISCSNLAEQPAHSNS